MLTMLSGDHPRLRGEYLLKIMRMQKEPGSPPLARGILCDLACVNAESGITPACAGNTLTAGMMIRESWDHPRLRGEYM